MPIARPVVALLVTLAAESTAGADDPLAAQAILDQPQAAKLESIRVRFAHYDQDGHGYQSQASPIANVIGPGSEQLTVEQPQLEVTVSHSDKLRTRLWLPLDVITAASPDAIDRTRPLDAMSSASRQLEAGNIDFLTTYAADRVTSAFVRGGFHLEQNFRSWNFGAGITRSLADDNATFFASLNQVVDWFDAYDITGVRRGHLWRDSTNVNVGISQLLSPTTVAAVNYGFTVQYANLGNTWNSVPLDDNTRGPEILPDLRLRSSLVGKIAQALPWWGGVLKGSYRFYADSWGVFAHTVEAQLYQRLAPWLYLRGNYRIHYQNGVSFFTTLGHGGSTDLRTADSDLARFYAQTFGGRAVFDWRTARSKLRGFEVNLGYEYYLRSNDLRVHIVSCGMAFSF